SLRRRSRDRGRSARRCTVGQLDHPVLLFAGVIFLKPRALETAREAVVDTGNLEFLVGNAHVDPAFPAPATLRIFGIEIIVARLQWPFYQRFAGRAVDMPPAFADPTRLCAIAYGNADQILCCVAYAEIGSCRQG